LDESTQQWLLGIVADEAIPNFEMSTKDIRKAYASQNSWEVRIVNPPFPGFNRNNYIPIYSIRRVSNIVALEWADAATADDQDDDDPAETVFGSGRDPVMEEEPVRSTFQIWTKHNTNLEHITGCR